ncbi:Protein of uncharacterised function (DUF1353) [Burkholderia cepacia]|uniref:Protein of uncharacterized function (DUF1353) n=1 Tax=Burkholderia cepacia TaxID=292 RepID=A0AAE8N8L8_BURCE|nr:DUF1353 domain-containing protein [Burkholderia cepacia]POM15729.1 hypothetical protein CSX04_04018 [Burkholderia cepacia]SPV11580.1 Protein of uncharacterised function (DUF1353) [Burkholderia cepacia]
MSKFLSPLQVELISDATNSGRGTWRLTAPLPYQSEVARQVFVVPAGFETDFASVPRAPVAFLLTADSAHAASAVHDFLYTAPHPVSREIADAVLKEASIASGVPAWRAWLMWAGVRIGGAAHWGAAASATSAR